MRVLLIDVDSIIPNLALMHLSTFYKTRERCQVGFNVSDPDKVYASIIFSKNRHLCDGLRFLYPNAEIDIGGSGYDLHKKLPEGVDKLMPDYSLYPDYPYDLGFTTRGCDRNCYFCIVNKKEGNFHIHQHPSEFHDPSHKGITLMDNNILWDKDWFFEVTDWIIKNKLRVDFNQGLDIRLIDDDIAKRISELRPIKNWHFAFDSMNYKDAVISGIETLNRQGVNMRHDSNFYVYLHDDDQFEDALERIKILREQNVLPYLMINPESKRTQRMSNLKRYTRPWVFFLTEFEQYDRRIRA